MRLFQRGDTLWLELEVQDEERRPVRPSGPVTWVVCALGGDAVASGEFTYLGEGRFRASLETADLVPGEYLVQVTLHDGPHVEKTFARFTLEEACC